jgi:hypothetical protein
MIVIADRGLIKIYAPTTPTKDEVSSFYYELVIENFVKT